MSSTDSNTPLKSSPAEVLSPTLGDGALPVSPPISEGDSGDEDELWADLLDYGDLPGADDGLYDSDDDGGLPSSQDNNSPIVAHFVVDQEGCIRTGPQPLKERPFDISGLTDELIRHLFSRLVPYKDGHVRAVDDYTGLDFSWAQGRPDALSMEAMYPFTIGKGQILYHAPSNVGLVSSSLNWLKRRHPIIVLALLGLWLRILQEPNFERRKAGLAWVYTSLLNAGVMGRVFLFNRPHEKQIEEWQQWPPEKLEAVLEHGRTGAYGPAIDAALAGRSLDQLFLDARRTWRRPVRQAPDWNLVYQWLVKIANKYGLTQDDFDYYFTLPAPTSSRSNDKVFYPFSVLSRAQAKAMSWDWCCLFNVAGQMLDRMRRHCNKHAQAEGYGEHEMDPLRLIYWWGHHLCQKVQKLKGQQPPLTREEIAYSIGDQWGFAVLPWAGNILKASLCRARDHGVAMRFGLNLPNNGQPFDPVEHWDFFLCTVTIDSQATNMAMRNFAAGLWESIRQMIMAVQPSHTHWRLDKDLGLRSWVGEFETEPQPRQPPELPFEIPLVPIDSWLGESTTPPSLQCTMCPDAGDFATPGLLVRHYREQHSQEPSAAGSVDPGQDKTDEAFWTEHLTCRQCAKPFSDPGCLVLHIKEQHSGKTYPCPDPGCNESFTYLGTLRRHMALKHSDESPVRFPCTEMGCNSSFSRPDDRDRHVAQYHLRKPPGGLRCPDPGCDEVFTQSGDLAEHVAEKHPDRFLCSEPGCHRSFTRRDSLQAHVKKDHSAEPSKTVKFTCPKPGCGKSYTSRPKLNKHN
ncbi:b226b31c-ec1d-4b71-8ca7-9485d6eda6f1 [Thermothielavioides terrestris]|uniref:B226b31c-ec1d-4b71-8ca7-9485d6eda6f1 n=1 Tax=Thermothielavioides terrestris TaxID=2587410 RepID=A0A3S4APZ2_9PEZI|nr:b226b31c-ec1d-4b71-8ca7-9485d6eda6f1 [Thermothielavioides terrestris]